MIGERLFIFILILIPSAILLGIHLASTYYFGKIGAVFSAIGISFVVSLGYHVFLSWAKGMGDSKGTGPSHSISLVSTEFFICLGTMAILSIGVYYFAEFLKTGVLNKLVFFTWLAIVVGTPVTYFGIIEIRESRELSNLTTNYVKASFDIYHYNELPIYIERITFENTNNKFKSDVYVKNNFSFYSRKEIDTAEILERLSMANIHEEVREQLIPLGANKFYMSWYSFTEDKYYNDEFPFPTDEFKVRDYQLDQYKRMSVDLFIRADGKVDMIADKNNKLFPYFNVETKDISQEEIARFKQLFIVNSPLREETFNEAINEIKSAKRLAKRMEMSESQFNWRLSIDRPDSEFSIRMTDFRCWSYETSSKWQNAYSKKNLPSELAIYFKKTDEPYFQVYFKFDMERLYDVIDSLVAGDKEKPVEMLMVVEDSDKDRIKIFVATDQHKVEFKDWDTNIVKY